jgi:chromate transport protein ChrA
MGYLAVRVATHHGAESDQTGALAQIAKLPGGTVVLWLTVVGLFALGLWLLIQAALGIGSSSKKRWVRSIVSAAKAIAYIVLGWTALKTAVGAATSAASSSAHASASVLTLPGGRVLLILLGLIAIAVGGNFIAKGIRRKFLDDSRSPSGTPGVGVTFLGVLGYVAKGIAIVVVGILFIVASVTLDPNDASGLDGALKALARLPFGEVVLIGVGVGLGCYGVYSFARARLARL